MKVRTERLRDMIDQNVGTFELLGVVHTIVGSEVSKTVCGTSGLQTVLVEMITKDKFGNTYAWEQCDSYGRINTWIKEVN